MRKRELLFALASWLTLALLCLAPKYPGSALVFVAQALLGSALALAITDRRPIRGRIGPLLLLALLQAAAWQAFRMRESAREDQARVLAQTERRLSHAAIVVRQQLDRLSAEAQARAAAALDGSNLESLAATIELPAARFSVAISIWENDSLVDWAGALPGIGRPPVEARPLLVDHGYRRSLTISALDSTERLAVVEVDLGITREFLRRLSGDAGPEQPLAEIGEIAVELRPQEPAAGEWHPDFDRVLPVPESEPWIWAILRAPSTHDEQRLVLQARGTALARWLLAATLGLGLLALRRSAWQPTVPTGGDWLLRSRWPAVLGVVGLRLLFEIGGILGLSLGERHSELALLTEPAYFATRWGFGLLHDVLSLLATGIALGAVALIALPDWLRLFDDDRRPRRLAALTVLLLLTLALVPYSASLQDTIAQNANARLTGVLAPFFTLPFLSLHLGMLLLLLAPASYALLGFERWLRASRAALVVSLACWGVCMAFGIWLGAFANATWCALLPPLAWAIRPAMRERAFSRRIIAAFAAILWFAGLQSGGLAAVYLRMQENVQSFEAHERLDPPENWRDYLLRDLLSEIANDAERVRWLADPAADRDNAAFELWAASSLAPLRYASRIELQGRDGRVVSQFDFGLPYDPRPLRNWAATATPDSGVVHVERLQLPTERGHFQVYRGSLRLDRLAPDGDAVLLTLDLPVASSDDGVEFDLSADEPIPLGWAPSDELAPRPEFERRVLWGRVVGDRIVGSSDRRLLDLNPSALPPDGVWRTLSLAGHPYRLGYFPDAAGGGLVVAFELAPPAERVLDFSRLVALYTLGAALILACVLLARAVKPAPRRIWPARLGDFGFQERLLGVIVVVVLLPLLLSAGFQQRRITANLRAEHEQEVQSRVSMAQNLIASGLDEIAEGLVGGEYVQEILRKGQGIAPREYGPYERSQVMVFDPDGELILDESLRDFDRVEARRFLDDVAAGHLLMESERDAWYLGRLYPVRGPQGESFQVFVRRQLMDVDLASIARTIEAELTLYDGPWAVLSSQDHLLRAGLVSPVLARPIHRLLFEAGRTSHVESTPEGNLVVGSGYAAIAGVGMGSRGVLQARLFGRATQAAVEKKQVELFLFGLSSLAFLLAIAVGLWISGRIVGPLRLLVGATRSIGAGALDTRLPAHGHDEFAQLMHSFNQMAADLREGQRALAARRSYLESVLGNLSAGVIVLDAHLHAVESNNAADRLLGARRAEFVQRVIGLRPRTHLIASEITFRVAEDPRTLRCVVDPVQREDGTQGWLVLFDDVTELLASRRLSLYAEMARQVAHEVKNPLTPIQLAAQMIRQAFRDRHARVEEIVDESVEQIERQVQRLRGIVSEFSMLGRVEPLQLSPLRVRTLLEEIRGLYPSPDGELDFQVEVDSELTVLAEHEAIVKVLSNLVENARQAVGGRGQIRLRGDADGDQVRLCILDDGPGIASEVQERLFEPYFSTKHSGTGLGLVICRSLVERMGGSIRLGNRVRSRGAEAELRLARAPLDGGNDS